MQYKSYATQFKQFGTDPPTTVILGTNELNFAPYTRQSAGLYRSQSTSTLDTTKIWISGMSDYQANGTTVLPIIGAGNTVVGSLNLKYQDNGGLLDVWLYVRDNAGTLVDLYSLIGEEFVYLPEVRMYN